MPYKGKGEHFLEEEEARALKTKIKYMELLLKQLESLADHNTKITDCKQKRANIKTMLEVYKEVVRY